MIEARQRRPAGQARVSRAPVRHARGILPAALLAAVACGGAVVAEEQQAPPAANPPSVPPAANIGPADQSLGVEALIAAARVESAAGRFVEARDLYQRALLREPGNAVARGELVRLEAVIAGHNPPLTHDGSDPSLRQQVAAAEARMAIDRAELMSRAGHDEDAVGLLSAARSNLLPYQSDATVRAEVQRIDALIQTCQKRTSDAADAAAAAGRSSDLAAATGRMHASEADRRNRFLEQVARIESLEQRQLYELALATCRRLVTDYPTEPEANRLFARLLAETHEQRRLTQLEQKTELLQEVNERVERSMIPTGFDGNPIYPSDWSDRHAGGGSYETPAQLPAWQLALLDRLDTRISYNFEGQSAIDVLNALARQNNVNLVIDPSVQVGGDKPVTLKANNITLGHTLDWVCRLIDARWHLSKEAIYVGGDEDKEPQLSVYDISDLLFQAKDQTGKLLAMNAGAGGGGGAGGAGGGFALFKNAMPDNAPAVTPEDLVDHIQKAVSPETWTKPEYGITVRGTMLMVTAPPNVQLLIQRFIHEQSNVRNILVRVEARWLTIEDGYLEEIGVNWSTLNGLLKLPGNPAPTDGYHRATNDFDHAGSLTNNMPATAVNPDPATFGTGLTLHGTLVGATQLSAIMTAVERTQRATILESPTVTTVSGVRATCFFGHEFAYISDYDVGGGGGNGLSSTLDPKISVLNFGASLDVKPQVSSDGKYVTMEFRPALVTLESLFEEVLHVPRFFPLGFNAGANGGLGNVVGNIIIQDFPIEFPNILVDELSTNVIIPDQGTLLVGGFGKHIEQTTTAQIPFLGTIPYVGRLFGQRGRYSTRSQLYLMATVHIINYQELEAKL